MEDDHRIKVVFNRTFANVGSPNSTDTLSMHMPASVAVTIEPSFSSFSVLGEKIVYSAGLWPKYYTAANYIWNNLVECGETVYTFLPGSLHSSFSMSQILKIPPCITQGWRIHKNGILGH